jgi:peptide deformylase
MGIAARFLRGIAALGLDRARHSRTLPGPKFSPREANFPTGSIDPNRVLAYFTGMAIRPIITLPDPLLRKVSLPVERVDDDLRRLMDDMLETMYAAPGIGLAAVQVGVPRRVVVLDVAEDDEERQPLYLVNPEIVSLGTEMRLHEEGCLSIPEVRVEIERPASLVLRYTDRAGERQELEASGLLATAVQHEINHLDGKLIIDFLSSLKRDMVVRKFKKQSRTTEAL